ncbi:MAG: twin-arginine translocase TatA/TatE family subunit [Pirellulales bacterium]|nr:twin-arginine translocase TatA/TatE family subunit [Pirellulales bacterium]|tara:strand:- start:1702 stop:1938 length:237 start_codon:yes stop_codon:yes gene_type:complete
MNITPLAFMGVGSTELMVILGIMVLLFGSSKLPKLARSMGKSATEFKKGLRGDEDGGSSPSDDDEDDDSASTPEVIEE